MDPSFATRKPTGIPDDDGAPVAVARARQYDFVSTVNAEGYRVTVATPPGYDGSRAYPVLYVLEGNVYFATAADAMARQAQFHNVTPALVVGIGYPSQDVQASALRRWSDLTPSASTDPGEKRRTGGGDAFLRVIEEEVKPLVMARYRVDTDHQALWGHSIGGLTVLRALFLRTSSFSTFLMSSPSIWWENQMVLRDEPLLAGRRAECRTPVRVLVTSAGEEQYRGTDARLLAEAEQTRMIDNATELVDRLRQVHGGWLTVARYMLEGENHISVSHAALTRALRFAFPLASPRS